MNIEFLNIDFTVCKVNDLSKVNFDSDSNKNGNKNVKVDLVYKKIKSDYNWSLFLYVLFFCNKKGVTLSNTFNF